jgi:methylmalonyl-CoA/ethylmalonyl-CoA epimerase
MDLPGIVCIHHVAVSVPAGTLQAQVAAYQALGFDVVHREEVLGPDQVREVLLKPPAGESLIQLLEPLSAASPVQKAIDANGGRGGLAHIAYRVRDIHAAFEHMRRQGYRILDPAPRPGSRGTTIFFVHPKSREAVTLGYLMEIVQE